MSNTVYLELIGCKRRKLDIERVKAFLKANNYKIISNPKNAEFIVLSTCAFKEEEEERGFKRIDYLSSLNKRLLILGCLPKISPKKFQSYNISHTFSPNNLEEINSFFDNINVNFKNIPDSNLIPSNLNSIEIKIALRRFFKELNFSLNFFEHSYEYLANKDIINILRLPKESFSTIGEIYQ